MRAVRLAARGCRAPRELTPRVDAWRAGGELVQTGGHRLFARDPELGHYPQLEDPGAAAAVIERVATTP